MNRKTSDYRDSVTIRRAVEIYRDQGALQLFRNSFRFCYRNLVRSQLPRTIVVYNGVRVRAARLGDSLLSGYPTDIPGYENALVRGIRRYVQQGDTVVIVGGGWGVSTVTAAKRVGDDGRVVTFEGAKQAAKNVVETVNLNGVSDKVSVKHTVVAHAISLQGNEGEATTVPSSELPECDVLVLDCEGAELDILENMDIWPEILIVETHGMFGAPKSKIRDRLEHAEYKVVATDIAEERLWEVCEENGIYVLTAASQNCSRPALNSE